MRMPGDVRPVPVHRLAVEACDGGVVRLALGRRRRPPASAAARRWAARAERELGEYLAGRRTSFTVPVDLRGLGPFQARVLAAVRRIPYGEVVSYRRLARRIGRPRAARAVGNALAGNPVPVLVPCHRVVRADGTFRRYALGRAWKTRLLALERRASPPGRPRPVRRA